MVGACLLARFIRASPFRTGLLAMKASRAAQKSAAEQGFSLVAQTTNLARAASRDFASFIRD
jgi:hypothetical protein